MEDTTQPHAAGKPQPWTLNMILCAICLLVLFILAIFFLPGFSLHAFM
jgi:hypothetical protein